MNGVKLAYVIDGQPFVVSLNTKKAAQMLDRFLQEEYGETASKIIYDELEDACCDRMKCDCTCGGM